jgi:dienelactone hydrolase
MSRGVFFLRTGILEYQADGLAMAGWLAYDEACPGPRPGVLVFPAAPGLGSQVRNAALRLAELGYVALGCDLYGGGRFFDGIEPPIDLLSDLRARLSGVRDRANGAMEALSRHAKVDASRIAAIGYCFGGVMALELARSGAPLAAAIGFHTPLLTERPQDAKNIKGRILICTGSEDREAGSDARAAFEAEMRAGGVDWHLSLYGGVYHSFTNPDAGFYQKPDYARYDPYAHERSWREMLDLLEEVFSPGTIKD